MQGKAVPEIPHHRCYMSVRPFLNLRGNQETPQIQRESAVYSVDATDGRLSADWHIAVFDRRLSSINRRPFQDSLWGMGRAGCPNAIPTHDKQQQNRQFLMQLAPNAPRRRLSNAGRRPPTPGPALARLAKPSKRG